MVKGGKRKKRLGFQSGAGLIRYFEAEDERALKINPWAVVIASIAIAIIIEFAWWYWPL
ncbi:MAG: preprotein translocase subunit Sec61beta [Thermoplasmata archaeon]|nr:MAG: preprotein translocase subunit Sec61beta [Thermoplasmata archaeon]